MYYLYSNKYNNKYNCKSLKISIFIYDSIGILKYRHSKQANSCYYSTVGVASKKSNLILACNPPLSKVVKFNYPIEELTLFYKS